MAVEKAPVWTFPTNPKRVGRWYGKGPADRSPVGPGPAAARRASSAMVPVRRFRGPRNMETDGIMRKEDGPIRHKENGAVRFRRPCRESNPGHAVPLARKRPAPPEYGRCPAWGVASADGCDADEVVAVAGLQPLAAVGGRVHGALLFAPVDPVASFRRLPKEIFKESDDPARMYRFGEVYRLSPGVPPDDQLVPVIVRE